MLEHRDADDAGWAPVASGIRSLGFSFTGGRLERVTLTFAATGDPVLADGSAGSGVDPATVPAPSTLAATGVHTVSGIVRDRAGNASRSATATVRVDASPPTATLTCPAAVREGEPAAATWTAATRARD